MRSKQFVWVAMLVLAGTTGCAMCDNAQDCTYSAFGGKWLEKVGPRLTMLVAACCFGGAVLVRQVEAGMLPDVSPIAWPGQCWNCAVWAGTRPRS